MEFQVDEKQSLDILIQVLKQSGLNFRLKSPDEEGGFFYFENGERKRFNENIFVKRSIKAEAQTLISINDICEDGDEREIDSIDNISGNLNTIGDMLDFEDELYDSVEFFDLKEDGCCLSDFNISPTQDDAA